MRQFTRKDKDTSSIRQFTRKDVEDCFNKSWGAAFRASGDTVTINGIAWLWGVTPPTWRVDYRIESVTGFRYHDVVLLVQHYWTTLPGRKEFYLTPLNEQALPAGGVSVKEEDVLLMQQREAATPLTNKENT